MIWPFIFISYASLFTLGISDNVRGPLFPEIMKQFGVSDSMGALMYVLSSIAGLAASYAAHSLLRRFDRLQIIQGAALTMVVALVGLAASPAFSVFLMFSFLMGVSLGILGLIPNILVPIGSTPHRKQRMLSGLHTMYGLSSLLAPLLTAAIAAATGNWRWVFATVALAPVALLIYSFHPSHRSLHKKVEISSEDRKANKKKNFAPQIFLAVMLSLAVAAEIMISSRLALYMQRTLNFSTEAASLYVTYFFVSMMVGRLLFSFFHFKRSPQYLLSTSLILTGLSIAAGVYVHPLFLALTGFTIAPFYPMSIAWVSSEFPTDLDAAVSYMKASDSIVLILMHLAIGKLTDVFSIQTAILAGISFVVVSLLMVVSYKPLFHKPTRPEVKPKAPHISPTVFHP